MTAPLLTPVAGAIVHVHEVFAVGKEDSPSWAVRSSGTVEDSAASSFAGLHDTVLDVRTAEDLRIAEREPHSPWEQGRADAF